jgi:hypothetical protein
MFGSLSIGRHKMWYVHIHSHRFYPQLWKKERNSLMTHRYRPIPLYTSAVESPASGVRNRVGQIPVDKAVESEKSFFNNDLSYAYTGRLALRSSDAFNRRIHDV